MHGITTNRIKFTINRTCMQYYYDSECDVYCKTSYTYTCDGKGNIICNTG